MALVLTVFHHFKCAKMVFLSHRPDHPHHLLDEGAYTQGPGPINRAFKALQPGLSYTLPHRICPPPPPKYCHVAISEFFTPACLMPLSSETSPNVPSPSLVSKGPPRPTPMQRSLPHAGIPQALGMILDASTSTVSVPPVDAHLRDAVGTSRAEMESTVDSGLAGHPAPGRASGAI